MEGEKVVLIALSGCSSSGKTTLAKLTAQLFPQATLIHEDDFYKHDEDVPMNTKYNIQDWDSVEALDFELFAKELDNISRSGTVSSKLIHNNNVDSLEKFQLDQERMDLLKARFEKVSTDLKIVIVDGFLIFHDPVISSKFDLKLFIRAPYDVLKSRRAARPGYQTLDSFWVDPPYYFDEFVYKTYRDAHSHLFVDNNVEGELKPEVSKTIKDFNNDDNTDINDALDWVCDQIVSYCL
ncbi:Nicotinamide riboside kinase [Nakaseomyces bracarensis]|uniref:Nicotinamide riboside kinase n=1 Tax=Nakaseomyces bracarensis TaxID=273131 RepID=A0ABR4NUT4_9SACH